MIAIESMAQIHSIVIKAAACGLASDDLRSESHSRWQYSTLLPRPAWVIKLLKPAQVASQHAL